MGIENRYEGIDEYAAWLIRYKAQQLVGHAGFTKSDRDDLEQEMVLDLLRRLPKYNSECAQRNTFIARVIEHKVAAILKACKAAKRDYRCHTCSLNNLIEDADGVLVDRLNTIDQEQYLRRTGNLLRSLTGIRELHLDLETVVADLPPLLQSLCRRLQHQNVSEISKATGVPRSTIYDAMKKLRKIFENAGLGKDF